MRMLAFILCALTAACGPSVGDASDANGSGHVDGGGPDAFGGPFTDGGMAGCNDVTGCFTVYAHGDHTLYRLNLQTRSIELVGPFNAPKVMVGTMMVEDVITDLAVAPDDTVWVVSNTSLYTASTSDGHVTKIGSLAACGQKNVGLTFTNDGKLYVADFKGAFCQIHYQMNPPVVTQIAMTMGRNLALTGDLVAVSDGTVFGTAYNLSDSANIGTQADNVLVKIDPATGQVLATVGSTGFPKLFGVAFDQGKVFGFTHDQTGHVVTIDPATGTAAVYGTFDDPTTHMPISFAGAGVSPAVNPIGKPAGPRL